MAVGDEILWAIAENRLTFAKRVVELRLEFAADERMLRRKIKEIWIAAMRRHYTLVDQYLMLRDWAPETTGIERRPFRDDVHANELWAPSRPDEVPESIRPNLAAEIETRQSALA